MRENTIKTGQYWITLMSNIHELSRVIFTKTSTRLHSCVLDNPLTTWQRLKPQHRDVFGHCSKSCYFSNIRCFFELLFTQNGFIQLQSHFLHVQAILVTAPNLLFCKGYSLYQDLPREYEEVPLHNLLPLHSGHFCHCPKSC